MPKCKDQDLQSRIAVRCQFHFTIYVPNIIITGVIFYLNIKLKLLHHTIQTDEINVMVEMCYNAYICSKYIGVFVCHNIHDVDTICIW